MEIYSLGSVTFSDVVEKELYIEEEYTWLPVGQTVRRALQGNVVVLENDRAGKPLSLIAKEDGAWLTKATVRALAALASVPNTTYILYLKNDDGDDEYRNVAFRRDSTPLDLTPLDTVQRYFVGRIQLIQV